jgi:hypothetical protein
MNSIFGWRTRRLSWFILIPPSVVISEFILNPSLETTSIIILLSGYTSLYSLSLALGALFILASPHFRRLAPDFLDCLWRSGYSWVLSFGIFPKFPLLFAFCLLDEELIDSCF